MALIGISLTIQRRKRKKPEEAAFKPKPVPVAEELLLPCQGRGWLARADEVSGLGTSLTWELLMPNVRVYA